MSEKRSESSAMSPRKICRKKKEPNWGPAPCSPRMFGNSISGSAQAARVPPPPPPALYLNQNGPKFKSVIPNRQKFPPSKLHFVRCPAAENRFPHSAPPSTSSLPPPLLRSHLCLTRLCSTGSGEETVESLLSSQYLPCRLGRSRLV